MIKTFSILVLFCFLSGTAFTQMQKDEEGFDIFLHKEGDTTYVMKQYFMCALLTGPDRTQSTDDAALIQQGHLAHLDSLDRAGKLTLVGPYGDEGDARGIAIYNTKTKEEAVRLSSLDPAVKSGRLIVEIRPIWLAKGTTLR